MAGILKTGFKTKVISSCLIEDYAYIRDSISSQMQSIVFQYSYEHVYKGARMVLRNKGYSVVKSDRLTGLIKSRKYFLGVIPSQEATLNINKMDDKNIRVTVTTAARGILFRNKRKAAIAESRIVEVMASII